MSNKVGKCGLSFASPPVNRNAITGLQTAFARGELSFFGDLAPFAEPAAFAPRLRALRQCPFVVYAKPPFGGTQRVLAYLARYTHRTAIGNSRLVDVTDAEVTFRYKNYRRGGRGEVIRLKAHEFLRRFLLHVLPDGFHAFVTTAFSPRATATTISRARVNSCAITPNGVLKRDPNFLPWRDKHAWKFESHRKH